MRATPSTFAILQDLGFLYHTDDLSRDEPFIIAVRRKPFVVVPYTFQLNDLQNYENRWHTCDEFASELKREFDALYVESERKRRMMSVSTHDRVAGRASRTQVIEEFITYAQRQPGVVFHEERRDRAVCLVQPAYGSGRRSCLIHPRSGHVLRLVGASGTGVWIARDRTARILAFLYIGCGFASIDEP
jgi:hypothetical protein